MHNVKKWEMKKGDIRSNLKYPLFVAGSGVEPETFGL